MKILLISTLIGICPLDAVPVAGYEWVYDYPGQYKEVIATIPRDGKDGKPIRCMFLVPIRFEAEDN